MSSTVSSHLHSPDPAAASGLRARESGQPIPLEHVHVEAHVVDLAARVTLRQTYRNQEKVPLEVVYVFPLDENAAVCAFEATVGGVRYVGQVKEREEAFRDYDDAMEAGHGAYLLDEVRADVFTASLGNLEPGGEVELSITYVTELAAEGAAVRFTLPTTVSPRYAPAEDQAGVGQTPAEALNPPVALDVPYAFTLEMAVMMGGAIGSVRSPSHPIEVEHAGTNARVRLSQRDAAMDRDLVIVIAAEGLDAPHATCERGEKGSAVMVSFVPRLGVAAVAAGEPANAAGMARPTEVQAPAEVVFVVDRSGSMGGDSIAEVRNALQLCLRSLSAGCRFNIVSFGSSFSALFKESRVYDDASLKQASGFVAGMDANMGGTEILPALESIVSQKPIEGLPRQVVLLTDGEVTNTDAVIALAKRHAGTTRFFTFGIGAGASQHLVRGIARASGGAAEFIAPGERIEAKVMRQFKRLLAPALVDVKVEWDCGAVTQAPARVPAVFDGERMIVYALGDDVGRGMARLSGTLAGRETAFEVAVDPGGAVERGLVTTLAARARIRDLEEEGEYLESRGSRQNRVRGNRKAADEIVALGVKYQLASRETSFVAIEHRDVPAKEQAELRRVPVALTHGWGGIERGAFFGVAAQYLAAPQAAAALGRFAFGLGAARATRDAASLSADTGEFASLAEPGDVMELGPARLRRRPMVPATPRVHDALVVLQRADGSWDLDATFAKAVAVKMRDLERALKGSVGDPDVARQALATAVALAWLEKHAAAAHSEWDMLARKALAWLAASGTEPSRGAGWNAWLDAARQFV